MKNNKCYPFYLLIALFLINTCLISQDVPGVVSAEDKAMYEMKKKESKEVKKAILDYVNGLYNADSTMIERSVHPELRKRGYWYNKKESAYRDNLDMSFEQLRNLAARWNVDGTSANENSPKDIVIYDVLDRTASAKLTAEWGVDYFHLAKLDGKWMIMNVIWQSLPDK